MAIKPGDRMACPACHLSVRVPVMEMRETRCDYCRARGRDTSFFAVFYPLGEVLIDHLKKIDPERDGVRRQRDEADLANAKRIAALDKEKEQERFDVFKDALISQLPSVGYTGKEQFQ